MLRRPIILIILDGFGIPPLAAMRESPFMVAARPVIHQIEKFYPFTALQASGIAVGLPVGEPGNSEVGHLTIGAGRALYQHLPRIISSIKGGSFFKNPAFLGAVRHTKERGKTLHIIGLLSTGSVHAYKTHLYALVDLAGRRGVPTMLHLFSDGKDAPTKEFLNDIKELQKYITQRGYFNVRVASVIGRMYAMDRDKHWGRVKKTYDCLLGNEADQFRFPAAYVARAYENGKEDIDIPPAWLADGRGGAVGRICKGNAVIMFNFREDSMRELTAAFIGDRFDGFARKPKLEDVFFVTMTLYDKEFPAHIAFPPLDIHWPLARVLAEAGKTQLHVAESEKYAHVTYFFNGGREEPHKKEDRILIPSPRVQHFDERPQMAADAVAGAVLGNFARHDFTVVNFANADMVGHTGNYNATVIAIETVDTAIGRIMESALSEDAVMIVTADHGNAEEKRYGITGIKRTKHTTNAVPFYLIGKDFERTRAASINDIQKNYRDAKGVLADVAPTVLELMGIKQPAEMTGVSLLSKLR